LILATVLLGSFPEEKWEALTPGEQQEIFSQKINEFSANNNCRVVGGQIKKTNKIIYIFGTCLIKKESTPIDLPKTKEF